MWAHEWGAALFSGIAWALLIIIPIIVLATNTYYYEDSTQSITQGTTQGTTQSTTGPRRITIEDIRPHVDGLLERVNEARTIADLVFRCRRPELSLVGFLCIWSFAGESYSYRIES
tara:strand:- start:362 stop:709 length:348 start_codon:yes stop_codon:yes gene_type:complete